jgi:hypothetical protein
MGGERMREILVVIGLAAAGLGLAGCAKPADQAAAEAVAETTLDDFVGYWEGTTAGSELERAAAALIEREEGGGFTITWHNVQAEAEEPGAETDFLVFRDREVTFQPTDRADAWTASLPGEGAYATAGIAGRTMTVEIVATTEEGLVERQIYRRTLTGPTAMTLHYTREVGGQTVWTVDGTYVRTGAAAP